MLRLSRKKKSKSYVIFINFFFVKWFFTIYESALMEMYIETSIEFGKLQWTVNLLNLIEHWLDIIYLILHRNGYWCERESLVAMTDVNVKMKIFDHFTKTKQKNTLLKRSRCRRSMKVIRERYQIRYKPEQTFDFFLSLFVL